MKLFRKILFWCHLVAGVFAGLVILIMSVTGVMLAYEKQITAWADTRNHQVAPPAPETARLPVETLLARVREAQPNTTITTVMMRADTSEPAAIALTGNATRSEGGPGSTHTIFVNPYTGVVMGEGATGVRNSFRLLTDWHRWLGASGASRATARSVTGACNLAFLFIVSSGFYLWWPRTWTRTQFKNILWFRRGLPGKARDFNWHNVIGIWSLVPLFIVVLSAVVISYTWAGNLVYRLAGETPPAPPARPAQATQQRGTAHGAPQQAPPPLSAGLNRKWTRAEQQSANWRSISLRVPASAEAPAIFTIDEGTGGQPQKRAQLTLDGKTGEVVKWEPFSSYTTGRQLRSILRFAHTGEVAGIIGQTLAGLISMGGAVLVWTGLAMAWRRFRAWKARHPGVAVSPSAEEAVITATAIN